MLGRVKLVPRPAVGRHEFLPGHPFRLDGDMGGVIRVEIRIHPSPLLPPALMIPGPREGGKNIERGGVEADLLKLRDIFRNVLRSIVWQAEDISCVTGDSLLVTVR